MASDRSTLRRARPLATRLAIGAAMLGCLLSPVAARALEIFACEPEWAALTRILVPDARITSATHARQDPHYIEARPALIGALRRADLAVCTGASLEAGWLPALQQRAGNAAVQTGRPGLFLAAEFVTLDDAQAQVDRSMGDVHAEGNPHFHLDPERLRLVARALADRLGTLDPDERDAFRTRLAQWERRWTGRIVEWKQRAAPLAGKAIVAQHTGFAYLWRWLGVRQTADLEPKPGLPPTVTHLQQVLQHVRSDPPFAVVQSLYQDPQAARWLVDRLPVPLLLLPSTVTDDGPARDLEGLFEHLIGTLLEPGPPTTGLPTTGKTPRR